jgi:2-dehydro-3-deoxyphosphooctonate aldolase (KDO 8-P synthase)
MEVHDNPAMALSDGANALALDKLRGLLEQLIAVQKAVAE